ncbi:uncharacterized protein LOC111870877 [Cryptotermes secundus]|uniref:uncharacterized protein LOC111870877 n=1 Tax=Cryptotermes secundus TaxID=105785 RepID=UPI001454E10F|nr:uncharacterized protein LOC111870877 [Cryptotermes secundus]
MMHARTPALCLVMFSALAAGYPSSSPVENTHGPTKIELLVARGEQGTSIAVPTSTAATDTADSRENTKLATSISPTSKTSAPVVDSGDRTRVELESNKPALKYFQTLLVDVLQPQPILDTIREEEKYGNDGEKLGQIGRSIVSGVTKFTSFLGSTVDLPYEVLKSITRKATETLNNVGAKIVGI